MAEEKFYEDLGLPVPERTTPGMLPQVGPRLYNTQVVVILVGHSLP